MRTVHPATGQEGTPAGPAIELSPGRWSRLLARADRLAVEAAARPYLATFGLLLVNMALAAGLAAAGSLLLDDPAEGFRELAPGTWLSFAELAFIAATAWAISRRAYPNSRRLDNFWALSAIVFGVFALDEITQTTIFLSDALSSIGTLAPAGFRDLDAFLLTVLFLAAGALLLRYAREALAHPRAVVLWVLGAALGAASQTLDSVMAASSSEFVAEESLKLAAEPFLLGGYLVALGAFMFVSRESGKAS